MNLNEVTELYFLITSSRENFSVRKNSLLLRKSFIRNYNNFVKNAFDTRRIDQVSQIIPRRGLQNYNRSEAFITEAMSQKIKNFSKLKKVLNSLKNDFGKDKEWHDSNSRILLSTLDSGLRTFQKDGDFSESQPSVGNLQYIDQLLNVRYRLSFDDLSNLNENQLKKIILAKDSSLNNKELNETLEINKSDIQKNSYEDLFNKLFGTAKIGSDGKSVERTITITIKDSVV